MEGEGQGMRGEQGPSTHMDDRRRRLCEGLEPPVQPDGLFHPPRDEEALLFLKALLALEPVVADHRIGFQRVNPMNSVASNAKKFAPIEPAVRPKIALR